MNMGIIDNLYVHFVETLIFCGFKVQKKLHDSGFRVETDLDQGSTLNKKVRNGQLAQYNFILGELRLNIESPTFSSV